MSIFVSAKAGKSRGLSLPCAGWQYQDNHNSRLKELKSYFCRIFSSFSPPNFSICCHFFACKRSLLHLYWCFFLRNNWAVGVLLKSQNSLYCSSNKEKKSLLWKVHWKPGRFYSIAFTFLWEKSDKFWQCFGKFWSILRRENCPKVISFSYADVFPSQPHLGPIL